MSRKAPGCCDVAITANPLDLGRVNNFERWESRNDLEARRKVANAPTTGIPFLSDSVMEYRVTDARPPFG